MRVKKKIGGRKYLDRAAQQLMVGFERQPTALLEDIIRAADELTGSNCWWVTYRIGPILRDAAEMELDRRKRMKERKAEERAKKKRPARTP